MALKYPDRIESNNPQAYGIVKATEVSGAKNAAEYGGLLSIPDNILSANGSGGDALYLLWIDNNSVYRLVDWENRHNTKGWRLEYAYIPWDSTAHLNSLTLSGQYYLAGQSNGLNGGLPILNSDPGHTFDAVLRVLDSSLTKDENEKLLCITLILSLSNRMGGDGHIFVRTIQTLEKDNLTRTDIESPTCNKWGTWEKLLGIIEKNTIKHISDLDTYTTNGMYSGLFADTTLQTLGGLQFTPGDTFLMVTVNGYAASAFGTPQLTQMLYLLPSKKGSGNNSARMYLRTAYWDKNADPKAWVWANWDRLATASEISGGGGGSIEELNRLNELIAANTTKISSVESTANAAKSAAETAQTAATSAQETANSAQTAATEAKTAAQEAKTAAENAKSELYLVVNGTSDTLDITDFVKSNLVDLKSIFTTDGNELSNSVGCSGTVAYIDLQGATYLVIEMWHGDVTWRGLAFYDADKNFIKSENAITGQTHHEIQVPENAKYFRTTWFDSTASNYNDFSCVLHGEFVGDGLNDKINNLNKRVSIIEGCINGDLIVDKFENKCWGGSAIVSSANYPSCEFYVGDYDSIEIITDKPIQNTRAFDTEPLKEPYPTYVAKDLGTSKSFDCTGLKWILVTFAVANKPQSITVRYGGIQQIVDSVKDLSTRVNDIEKTQDISSVYYSNRQYDIEISKPIVCFVFDSGYPMRQDFIDEVGSRGIRVTYAIDSNGNPDAFKSKMQEQGLIEQIANGCDIITHGEIYGFQPNMDGSGIGASDEESSIRRVRLNRADFRAAKLKDDVLVRFNYTKTDYPSTEDFISEFYKYALITKTDITAHDFDSDLLNINRIVAENWELEDLKNVIISNLNQPKLIVFGTHPAAFVPDENKYNKIKALFDFVESMAESGAIINVGLHEALRIIESWRSLHNVVPQRYRLWKLHKNEVFANNGKVYRCTDCGIPAVYEITINGTSSAGSITFSIDGDTQKTIDIAAGKTENDVASLFFTNAVYANYRTNVVGNKVYLTRSRTDDTSASFEVVANTSGCTVNVNLVVMPRQHVYEELIL